VWSGRLRSIRKAGSSPWRIDWLATWLGIDGQYPWTFPAAGPVASLPCGVTALAFTPTAQAPGDATLTQAKIRVGNLSRPVDRPSLTAISTRLRASAIAPTAAARLGQRRPQIRLWVPLHRLLAVRWSWIPSFNLVCSLPTAVICTTVQTPTAGATRSWFSRYF